MGGFTLYIVMVLGGLIPALLTFGIISFLFFFFLCCERENENEIEMKKRKRASRLWLILSAFAFSGCVFIPSQSEALILYGLPKILQSKKIPEPWQQLVNKNLLMTAPTNASAAFRNSLDND